MEVQNIKFYKDLLRNKNFQGIYTIIKNKKPPLQIFYKYIYEEDNTTLLHVIIDENEIKLAELYLSKLSQYLDKSSFDNYINHKEKNGFTALHYAIYNCSYELTKLLCNFGAKTNILSNQNESALDYAKKFKNEYSKILDCLNQNNSNKINIIYGKEVVSLNQNNNENNGTKSEEKIDKDIKIIDLNFKNEEINKNFSILEKSKPRGLKNINGSCYLNTVLQCLFHIKPLSMYFLKNINNFSNMPIAKAYSSVIFGLINQTSRNNAFEPEEFKRAMEKINPNYASFGNDPKDVIMDFLDNINHEILDEQDSFQYNNKLNKCDKFQLFNYYKKENEI